jgi:hypothetical protein
MGVYASTLERSQRTLDRKARVVDMQITSSLQNGTFVFRLFRPDPKAAMGLREGVA